MPLALLADASAEEEERLMSNQLMRVGLLGSKRLRRCSFRAHMAYPYVYLIADHWGRFEWDLPVLNSLLFGARMADVPKGYLPGTKGVPEGYLLCMLYEFEANGLLRRYQADGTVIGLWSDFKGLPESKRAASKLLGPQGDSFLPAPEGTQEVPDWYRAGTEAVQDRSPVVVEGVVGVPVEVEVEENDLVTSGDSSLLWHQAAKGLFDYWRRKCKHPRAQMTDARMRILQARLREEPGESVVVRRAGLELAVDGAVGDPWFNGGETGTAYLDFDNIFRNKGRDRIEKLQRLAREQRERKSPGQITEEQAAEDERIRVGSEAIRAAQAALRANPKASADEVAVQLKAEGLGIPDDWVSVYETLHRQASFAEGPKEEEINANT